eukprot:2370902-Prymnesium_polylepis.1
MTAAVRRRQQGHDRIRRRNLCRGRPVFSLPTSGGHAAAPATPPPVPPRHGLGQSRRRRATCRWSCEERARAPRAALWGRVGWMGLVWSAA